MNFRSLLLIIAVCMACTPKKTKTEDTEIANQAVEETTPPRGVQLTEAQKAEGWVPLFDGQSLAGWRTFKNKPNTSWDVRDGALHIMAFDDRKSKERADLITENEYENFEVKMDWKVAPQCNTGLMFHCTEKYEEPFLSGPEYQIIDEIGYPGKLKETNTAGGTYDMYVPQHKTLKPVGEWNSLRLIVKGPHVEHWMNGTKIVEYEIGSADWKKRKADSKWKDAPGYGAVTKGFFDLQDHGDEAWFRNILIRVL